MLDLREYAAEIVRIEERFAARVRRERRECLLRSGIVAEVA